MPDEHGQEHPDSLDRDVTRPGRRQELAGGDARSLGEQSTHGGQDSSMSDVGGLDGPGDSTGEVVDLAARYDIQGTLGRGGMGEVIKALDKRLERPVAIKRIRGELARHRKAMDRFLGEAKALARLNHFNIVQVHDYGRD